jgi:hypothetical protein
MEIPLIIPSVNPSVKKIYYYRGIYRRNGADKFIFLLPTDLPTEKNYRRKIHQRRISVGDSVGKLITDEICVLHRQKNSVGKTVKSYSVSLRRKRTKLAETGHFGAKHSTSLNVIHISDDQNVIIDVEPPKRQYLNRSRVAVTTSFSQQRRVSKPSVVADSRH